MKVSPSILSCDFSILKQEIDSIVNDSDYLHIDVMDGHFVPNITFGPGLIKDIRKHYNIIFDVHLMMSEPHKYIKEFCNAGSDIITFHYECESEIKQTIQLIKNENKKVGLSIKPNTCVESLIPFLHELDLVLVMSVEPGFGGQKFDHTSLSKIEFLKDYKIKNKLNYEIEVDGGINDETISLVKKSGVDVVVAGSYIFNSKDRTSKINSLK
ncbi:MAG: ribulose-phosphate 3-epimerase [bacterium]